MKYLLITAIMITAGLILTPSCKKTNLLDANDKGVLIDSTQFANVRFIHCFAGNMPQLPTAPNLTTGPQVFMYVNGKKLNGNALSYGGQWPSPNVYAIVDPGSTVRFDAVMARLNLAVVPNVPAPIAGDTLLTVNQPLQAGKFYSAYFSDTVGSYKLTFREDVMPTPDYQTYKIRMANWMMNPLDTFYVFSRREQAIIIPDISHKQISGWVQVNLPIISDTLEVRKRGTIVPFGTTIPFTPAGLRFYTIVLRGKNLLTGKLPSASILTNK
jgi:hypothetical protein